MKKMPTIFKRDHNNKGKLLNERNDSCLWVFNDPFIARRKIDGTCCMIKSGVLFKRREIKKGKTRPDFFILADYDELTGKTVGWVPVNFSAKEDKYHLDAFNRAIEFGSLEDGTYELLGPKIQGNKESLSCHELVKHDTTQTFESVPLDFEELKNWLMFHDIEGLVFYHEDGRMAKIKKKDFGLERKPCK